MRAINSWVVEMASKQRMKVAKDAVSAAPDVYTAVFENDSVNVMKAKMLPGVAVPMFYHPNYLIYVRSPSVIRIADDDTSEDLHPRAGDVIWMESGTHSCENVGSTIFEALLVEVK